MAGRRRVWRVGRGVAAALLLVVSAGAASAQDKASCDRLPEFAVEDRFIADEVHREAIGLIAEEFSEERKRRAQAVLPKLQRSAETVSRQHGRSGLVSVIVADWARLARIADEARYGEGARKLLRQSFEELLALAASPAEADYLVDMARTEARSIDEKMAAISRHRRVLGDQPRQVSLLSDFADALPEAGETLSVARLMREIAAGTGVERARYEADGAFVRSIANGARDSTAVGIAAALLPIAGDRLTRTRAGVEAAEIEFADNECFAIEKVVRSINVVLKDSASRAEKEANYELEALEAVTFGELETDYAGASEAYFDLLTLRAIDDARYRDLMRYFAAANPFHKGAEVGMALSGAEIFQAMLLPDLAREFIRDAKSWSADAADPTTRFTTLLKSLRFEWTTGGSSSLDADLAEAQSILASGKAAPDAYERIQFAIFEAEFYDSRLDDPRATEALARAVDIALGDVEDTFAGQNVAQEFQGDISTLIVEHLRGRFCGGCDAAMASVVAKFWRAAADYDREAIGLGQGDSGVSKSMTVQLSISTGPAASELSSEVQAELDRLAAATTQRLQKAPAAKRIISKLKPEDRRMMLVAANMFPSPMSLVTSDDALDLIVPLLAERELGKKRRMLFPIVAMIAEDASQFGGDEGAFRDIDAYARTLSDLKLPLSARVFTESVVRLSEPNHGIQYWTTLDEQGRLQLAKTLAPAYARLARFALEEEDWKGADGHLDTAEDLMARRLQQEWRVGNDQVGLLYRALQPALRLTAQLRFFLALGEKSRRALPDSSGLTFSDLQFAMLGDTSLAMQAAIRNSITRDDELRAALDARDAAQARLAQMDATEKLVPSKLPWIIEARRVEALAEIARAEAVIAERLTISEDFAALSPVPVAEAVAALQPDEALAVLHAGSNLVYGFVVRPGRDPVLFTSKVTLANLIQKVTQLRREASTFGAVDISNAATLYELLLRPAEKALDGVGHLVVVADGPLPGLPWAMLATGAAKSKAGAAASGGTQRGATPIGDGEDGGVDWAAEPFLIRKFPVSLAPNIRSLVAQRSGLAASKAPAAFLGVGNPLLRGSVAAADMDVETLYKRDGGIDVARLADLAPLPETAAELRALAGSLGAPETDLLLAADATETRLAERKLADYRVLAFATHGILAGEVGGLAEPGLVLSPETGGAIGHDGYLSLSEIMALKLDADLVILSACNTGSADGRPRAEWMSGLARGFIAAGTRQMLVTLWSIPSDPTVRLTTGMTSAYTADPALGWPRALQKSVLAMMDKPATAADAHPASWASFTVLGVGSAAR